MRISFGDYRAKMEKEEHKFKLGKAFLKLGSQETFVSSNLHLSN